MHTMKTERILCSLSHICFSVRGRCAFMGWILKHRLGWAQYWVGSLCVEGYRSVVLSVFPGSFSPPEAGWVNWVLPDPLRQTILLFLVLLLPPCQCCTVGLSTKMEMLSNYIGQYGVPGHVWLLSTWNGGWCDWRVEFLILIKFKFKYPHVANSYYIRQHSCTK